MKNSKSTLFIVAPLIFIELNSSFEAAMIYASIPALNRAFGDLIGVGWVVTATSLVAAASSALAGRLGDLYGRKKLLVGIPLVCACGSLISGLSSTLPGVILGAGIQGLTSGMLPLAFGAARDSLPKSKVAVGVGLITSSLALGSGLGIVSAGLIVDHYQWNTIFFLSAGLAVMGSLVAWRGVTDGGRSAQPESDINMWVGILFVPAVAALLFAVTQARKWGWGDGRVHAIVAASLLLLGVWSRHQWTQRRPLIHVRLLAIPQVALAYFCMAMVALGTMQVTLIMTLLLQTPVSMNIGFGLSAAAAGLTLLPAYWVGALGGGASGKVSELSSARTAAIVGLLMILCGWLWVVFFHEHLWLVASAAFLIQFGFFFAYAAIPNLLIEAVPVEHTSEATGIASVFRALFMAIGSQIVILILSSSTATSSASTGATSFPTRESFMRVFGYVVLTAAVCLVALLARPRFRSQLSHVRTP